MNRSVNCIKNFLLLRFINTYAFKGFSCSAIGTHNRYIINPRNCTSLTEKLSAFQTFVGFRNMAADVKFRRCIDQFVIHFLFTDLFHSRKRISPFAVTIADAVIASIYVPPMLRKH